MGGYCRDVPSAPSKPRSEIEDLALETGEGALGQSGVCGKPLSRADAAVARCVDLRAEGDRRFPMPFHSWCSSERECGDG